MKQFAGLKFLPNNVTTKSFPEASFDSSFLQWYAVLH